MQNQMYQQQPNNLIQNTLLQQQNTLPSNNISQNLLQQQQNTLPSNNISPNLLQQQQNNLMQNTLLQQQQPPNNIFPQFSHMQQQVVSPPQKVKKLRAKKTDPGYIAPIKAETINEKIIKLISSDPAFIELYQNNANNDFIVPKSVAYTIKLYSLLLLIYNKVSEKKTIIRTNGQKVSESVSSNQK